MSLIEINDLSFTYEGRYDPVFTHLSFRLDTDWRLGLVGRNGRGKTTFLRLLMGDYPHEGVISSPVSFALFPYPVPDPEALALSLMEDLAPEAPYWRIARELGLLEVDEELLYRPLSTLSGGERTKLQIAALFLREDRFLLIDEPTNHLDMAGREKLARYLAGKRGFILVSHDRALLDGSVDHILSFDRDGGATVCRGNYSIWAENRARQDAFEQGENEKLRGEIARLRTAAREKADWSDRIERTKIGSGGADRGYIGHQAARMMQRSKAIEKRRQRAVEEKEKLLKNVEKTEELKLTQLSYHARRLLSVRDVSVAYGPAPVFSPVSFALEAGDRLALLGKNGSGKSSLLRLLCGEEVPHTGTVSVGSGLVISHVPQETGDLSGPLTAYAARYDLDPSIFLAILRKLDFERVQFEKDMASYSAGQKKKVLLARSLCEKAHLHVWDEPMNYIDVISRAQLEDLILAFRPTLLFVEHDRVFVDRVATKTVTPG